MRRTALLISLSLSMFAVSLAWQQAPAYETLGPGTAFLLGGDLTDPTDSVELSCDPGQGKPEEEMIPKNATWVKMTCWPANMKPGEPPHQKHPYQSWVGTPAVSVFLNDPDNKKWYVSYCDGGYGGPTEAAPYHIAVQLKHPYTLTHFTIASSTDKPERDPKTWAIQGSNTGKDGDWTDIYRCNATGREDSPFRVYPRSEVLLYTSFTSEEMYKTVTAEDVKSLAAKLKGKTIKKADFAKPKPYTWFRFVSAAAFNGNTMEVPDPTNPAGFSLGQIEFFGTTTDKVEAVAKKGAKAGGGRGWTNVAPKIVAATTVAAAELAALPAIGKGELRKIISLDGEWDIAAGGMGGAPAEFKSKIPVPGLTDLATPGIGGAEAFWYHKKFTVAGPLPGTAVLKVFKAMYGTQVTLNGKVLGEHMFNFTPGLFDAAPALKVGENELLVRIGGNPGCTPKPIQSGYDDEKRQYIPGIYDSVELILSGAPHILRVQAVPNIASKAVTVHTYMKGGQGAKDTRVHVTVREVKTQKVVGENDCIVKASGDAERTGVATVKVDGSHLWSPEDPFLYELEVRGEADVIKTKFGMRTFTFDAETGFALLNGKTYFMRGSNITLFRFFEDPQRGNKPWNEAWVRKLYTQFKDVHWNSFRFSISQPPERWYELADEMGFLVQDEYPIWKMFPDGSEFTADGLVLEYTEWMQERWNHPCVVIWDANNETPAICTAQATHKVRGLDFSDRPWDNGWQAAERPGDTFEAHEYHFKDSLFRMAYLGRVPKGIHGNKEKNPVILNEYGWLWLNRDGSPTTLTRELYGAMCPGYSNEQLKRAYAKLLAAETEFWRHGRNCAAVMEFCGLGYSRGDGQTSDHWADLEQLKWDPDFYTYVRDAFAPVGIMIDAYDPSYVIGADQVFPISVINDLPTVWEGSVRVRILKDGKPVLEKTTPCKVDAFGATQMDVTMKIPAAGDYVLEAALVKGAERPVCSVRDFKAAATVSNR
jgi:beta-galactosidase